MKKIITVSVSIIMVFVVFVACTKTVDEAEAVSSTVTTNTELSTTQEIESITNMILQQSIISKKQQPSSFIILH